MTTDGTAKLFIFDCGYLNATAVPFITPTGTIEEVTTRYVSGCYLVQHRQGLLLWDTALADDLHATSEGARFGPWHMVVTRTLMSHLTALGLAPADITHLAFSHMHGDHTGNANLFTAATVLLNTLEYDAAFGAKPPPGYDLASYAALQDNPVIKVEEDHDVFGDGSVVILAAPGHTVGHQALMLQLPDTGTVILSGDLYYSSLDRTERRVPMWNYDREQTLQSMARIEAIARHHQALVLIQHDREQLATLPQAPACLT